MYSTFFFWGISNFICLLIVANLLAELLDRGWRRSGCFLYKPDMERMCCPSYTIRLKASDCILSKEQVRVCKKMQRFLDGVMDMKKLNQSRDKPNSSMCIFNLTDDESLAPVSASSGKESPADTCEKICKEDEFILLLSNKIDYAVRLCFGGGEFPTTTQLPKAAVKKVTPQVKKRLMETSEDLLYTSSICFQIAAVFRRLKSTEKDITGTSLSSDAELADISPKIIAEKLACLMKQHGELSDVLSKACNGHLNFYSATKKTSELTSDACKQAPKIGGNSKRSLTDNTKVLTYKRRKLEIRMKRSSFDPEEFELYRRYQIKVHDDKPEKVTESSYRRFLVDTPIVFIPPCSGDKTVPAYGYGSFHQQYVIDGKLIAVGVVDILPRCLSSKYLFWDPDFAFLSLGKYSALQEINWVKETQVHCPSIQYYYLGYYIHSCPKMRYKAAYRPSELLCPLRYEWVPFDVARPLLDKKSYVVLSDFVAPQDQPTPPQDPDSITRQLDSCPDHDGSGEASSNEDEITDIDFEDSDTGLDDESGSEAISASVTGDSIAPDVGNILIDLNGSRVKFKDLQRVFGPIEERHLAELEMQLHRYVKVVGKELADHVVYAL
ncbi:arginyl-tRNA--protein transferase 2 [Cocos nucifera]|nr:arginyl-tRNA--protein transferase 2 [Cocos nucifera]